MRFSYSTSLKIKAGKEYPLFDYFYTRTFTSGETLNDKNTRTFTSGETLNDKNTRSLNKWRNTQR
jgi:hypothetical protein